MKQDLAEEVKARVTMRDICDQYGFKINRANKAVCPFHSDTKPSMHIYAGSKGYHCFACGKGGDVIDFVMGYFGVSFKDALVRMNDDFGLGLSVSGDQSDEDRRKARQEAERRRRERDRERRHSQRLQNRYEAALDYFVLLDRIVTENAPDGVLDPFSDAYVYALKHIDEAWEMVQEAADVLRNECDEKGGTNIDAIPVRGDTKTVRQVHEKILA